MRPILGFVAGYPIYSFAILVDLGVAIGLVLALWLARRRGVPPPPLLDAAVGVLAVALAGARLQYVAIHWAEYAANPVTALYVWEGGLALPGALTAGALTAWLVLRRMHLPVGTTLDAVAPGVAIGQAIGRLGCLAAGCAVGAPVTGGSALPSLLLPDSTGALMPRFPSQLVESAAELALGLVLLALWRRRWRPGAVAAGYLSGYGLLRLAAEPLRGDSTFVGPLPAALWWAALAVAAGAVLLARLSVSRADHGHDGGLRYAAEL